MSKIGHLFLKYKKREERQESDCMVAGQIMAEYYSADEKARRHIVCWVFKRIESNQTNVLVRKLLTIFLYVNRKGLSKAQKKRFMSFLGSSKEKRRKTILRFDRK